MPFDFGWNFRNTLALVTDQTFATFASTEAYPNTYTNGDGLTVNAGWESGVGAQDMDPATDPRVAGDAFTSTSATDTSFRVDLSSGSGLGPGNYTVDFALGVQSGDRDMANIAVTDNGTPLLSNAGPIHTTNQYVNSAFVTVANLGVFPGDNWDLHNSPQSVTFSTSTCRFSYRTIAASFASIAHFRLVFVSAAGGGGAGACECSFFHSFDYREVADFMDCVVGRRS